METPGEKLTGSVDLWSRISRSHLDRSLSATTPVYAEAGFYPERRVGEFEVHLHAGVEVGILLTGVLDRYYQDCQYRATAGEVWLCGIWEPHGWGIPDSGCSRIVLNFLPEFLGDQTLSGMHWLALFSTPPRLRPKSPDPKRILAIAEEMQPEIEQRGPGWEEAVRLSLLKLLFTLGRNWPAHSPEAERSAGDLGRLLPAIELIRSSVGLGPSLAEAATACCLQRSQFARLFQRTMGASYGQFRLRLRLAHAAQLLREAEQQVEEIAAQAGFADGSHLHRSFVQQYGCTPATYRQRAG